MIIDVPVIERETEVKCEVCKDRGFLTWDVPYGHPGFGKLMKCPNCREEGRREALAAECGLPPKLQSVTFEKIVRHEGNAAAYEAARRLAHRPREFLTLTGPTGVGKSTLLAAIVKEALTAGFSAYYTTTADLLDGLRATFRPAAETAYEPQWEKLKSVRVLCLDEVDRFNASDWALEKLFQLISARYDYGGDRLTCFATNASIDTFPAYLQSRLRDRQCGLFELSGMDVRLCART
jgi:DNA replication protein DnaC